MNDAAIMLRDALLTILDRDLATLSREVEAYPNEDDLWRLVPGMVNSGGTLTLHLAGNLQHFIGRHFGGTGYARNRPAEFARRNVPRAELLREIEAARAAVRTGLSRITSTQLVAEYPEQVGDMTVATGDYLVHLATHLTYHLGQLDYHRRVITGNPSGVGAVRTAELRPARPTGAEA
jgi:DinB superfamily